jgi:hypothetical protein
MAARHSALVNACVDYINARGGMATRLQAGRVRVGGRWVHMSKSGWPDVIGLIPPVGRFLAVEVKVGRDTLSPVQRTTHAELEKRGALVVTVRDLKDLEAALA